LEKWFAEKKKQKRGAVRKRKKRLVLNEKKKHVTGKAVARGRI